MASTEQRGTPLLTGKVGKYYPVKYIDVDVTSIAGGKGQSTGFSAAYNADAILHALCTNLATPK